MVVVYIIQILFVLGASAIASMSGLFPWFYGIILTLPLVFSASARFSGLSFTLNARIMLPISAGLFFVTLYHYFPELVASQSSDLARYGLTNPGDGSITREFFEANDLFTTSVSVLYAICVAFMLWKGLTDFDELRAALSDEASEINAILDYFQYFRNGDRNENWPLIAEMMDLLLQYVGNIRAGKKIVISHKNDIVMRRLIEVLSKVTPKDANDNIALEEIMKAFSRVVNARSRRHANIQKTMSPFILTLIFLMSLSLLASFFGSATGEISVDYVYVFFLSMFYTSILMTLIDLSSPFDGYWAIKTATFDDLVAKISDDRKGLEILLNRQAERP